MKRSERLARIRQLRRLKEDRAAAELLAARQEIAGSRQLLSELEHHRHDYVQHLMGEENQQQNILGWRRRREFINILDTVITRQTSQIEKNDELLGILNQHWRQQHAGRRALDELVVRIEQGERRDRDRKEHRAQDDSTAARCISKAGGRR